MSEETAKPSEESSNRTLEQADLLTAFVSYTHDTEACQKQGLDPETHRKHVRRFVKQLEANGVRVDFDQYHENSPPASWPQWMRDAIKSSRHVFVVCTPTYYKRFHGEEKPGKGLGSRWEGVIITQFLYDGVENHHKFIPVGFGGYNKNKEFIPDYLRGTTYYDVSTERDMENLLRHITNQPRVSPGPIGKIPVLPPEEESNENPSQPPQSSIKY